MNSTYQNDRLELKENTVFLTVSGLNEYREWGIQ